MRFLGISLSVDNTRAGEQLES